MFYVQDTPTYKNRTQFQLTSTGFLSVVTESNVLIDSGFSVHPLIGKKEEREGVRKERMMEGFKFYAFRTYI